MKKPAIVAVLIVLGWWGISMTRSLSTSEGSFSATVSDGEEGKTKMRTAEPEGSAAVAPTGGVSDPSRDPSAVSAAPRAEVKKIPFEFQRELSTYAELKTKVLPSVEEEAMKALLLKNAFFLRSLGNRLVKTPLMELGEQNAAIDLLVEALQTGDKSAAALAIGEIVADKQVEDATLPSDTRDQLAGIKAELMYHWTALEPDQASTVSRSLPGPVSRKIWNNVLDAQKNNLAESAAETR